MLTTTALLAGAIAAIWIACLAGALMIRARFPTPPAETR